MIQELNYIRCGDYYIPYIRLPEESRPITFAVGHSFDLFCCFNASPISRSA